jgi:protein TonB
MLFVSWRLIELKTYEKDQFDYELILVEQDEEEEIPLTEQIKTPPPPPPSPVQAPTEIEIVEDEKEVEETIIESTEMDRDKIIEVEDVVIEEEKEIIDVPFAVIEDVPVFPGCEDVEKNQLRNCFQE